MTAELFEYRIDKIEDTLCLSPDQFNRFILDFKAWHSALQPLVKEGDAIISANMIWTDDADIGKIKSVELTDGNPPCCWECASILQRASWMILCPVCRNKRCPKATNHANECTGSNESGQKGSRYT